MRYLLVGLPVVGPVVGPVVHTVHVGTMTHRLTVRRRGSDVCTMRIEGLFRPGLQVDPTGRALQILAGTC